MTTTTTTAATFTAGQQLACRSACDYDCIFRFTVISRTAKFVTLRYYDEIKRVGIKIDRDGNEYCYPLGSYSMAPTIRAGENQ
jgi:hypothetical protein